ncbi:transposase [Streptomyces sp. NPDC048278]|uniref:transposase n=1 Tax=Streptomyces sp. NPDC048278 TaxID=3155809 RepID=UPI00342C2890
MTPVAFGDLWERIEPLLPQRPDAPSGPGRRRVDDRLVLAAVLYVVEHDVPWRQVPAAAVGCSGTTAWRRVQEWAQAGAWQNIRRALLAELPTRDGTAAGSKAFRARGFREPRLGTQEIR